MRSLHSKKKEKHLRRGRSVSEIEQSHAKKTDAAKLNRVDATE
jgi:hypothetical protein